MADDFREGLWDVSRAGYYADRECVSHSTLEVFSRSVATYHASFVTGEIASPGGTEAMDFGNAVHTALLEPDKFAELVAVSPEVDRRRTEGKQRYEAFLAESAGKIVVTQQQYDQLTRMVKAVLAEPAAAALLARPGKVEQAMRWRCPVTGIKLRCKYDKLLDDGPVIDIKTALEVAEEDFARQAYNLGYHRQAAFYQGGAMALDRLEGGFSGALERPFYFVVIGKGIVPEVVVYEPDAEMLRLGDRQNIRDLQRLRDCTDFGQWHAETYGRIVPLSLPRWAPRD